MSDVPNYRRATNMAYTALRALNVSMLPITIFPAIAQIPNLRVISYSEACDRFRMSWQEYISLNVSERGYICREGKKAIIFYNDRIDPEIIRFTIAHELGHFVLGHMDETSSADKEANCFARNFLCPVPVTDYWELADVGECCDIFDITPPAAQVVLDKKHLDRINTDSGLYQNTVQLLGLPSLTKEAQLKHHSARAMRAFVDFSIEWDDKIGEFHQIPERLHI